MPETITLEWLAEQYACEDQIEIFKKVFGDSAELNETNAVKALEAELDLDWLARHILTTTALEEFERIQAIAEDEYERILAIAEDEYERIRATSWDEYERSGHSEAEYDRIKDPAWAEFSRVIKTALAEYDRVMATAILSLIK